MLELYFLAGLQHREMTRQTKLTKGNFFHIVYVVEQKLGRAFSETRPYSVYPTAEYFSGMTRRSLTFPSPPLDTTRVRMPLDRLPWHEATASWRYPLPYWSKAAA